MHAEVRSFQSCDRAIPWKNASRTAPGARFGAIRLDTRAARSLIVCAMRAPRPLVMVILGLFTLGIALAQAACGARGRASDTQGQGTDDAGPPGDPVRGE